MMSKIRSLRSWIAVFVLSVLTVCYGDWVWGLFRETKACSSGVWLYDLLFPPETSLRAIVRCLSANEFGDALAGAFAPLAFMWLAGAVFIQSLELKAQREELTDNREVMRMQVAEMRASTALISEQTNILRRQHEIKEEEVADEALDVGIESLREYISACLSSATLQFYDKQLLDGSPGFMHDKVVQLPTFQPRSGDHADFMAEFFRHLESVKTRLIDMEREFVLIDASGLGIIGEIGMRLEELHSSVGQLSAVKKAYTRSFGLEKMYSHNREIIDILGRFERRADALSAQDDRPEEMKKLLMYLEQRAGIDGYDYHYMRDEKIFAIIRKHPPQDSKPTGHIPLQQIDVTGKTDPELREIARVACNQATKDF